MKKLKWSLLVVGSIVLGNCSNQPDVMPLGAGEPKKLTSIRTFEFDSSIDDFRAIGTKNFIYAEGRLVQIDWYEDELIIEKDFFEYGTQGRLILKKTLMHPTDNSSHFQNTTFDYWEDKTIITRFETTETWKSPEDVTTREKTSTGFKLNSSDGRVVDCVIDTNGNMTSQTIHDSQGFRTIIFKHDRSPNPQYFPDYVEDFLDFDHISKNNIVLIENSNDTLTTREIEYNSEGYPTAQVTMYPNKNKYRLEFEFH